jgi:hypothetical protein
MRFEIGCIDFVRAVGVEEYAREDRNVAIASRTLLLACAYNCTLWPTLDGARAVEAVVQDSRGALGLSQYSKQG